MVALLKRITRAVHIQRASRGNVEAVDARHVQALNRARDLEARAIEAYRQGVGMLWGGLKDAERARTTAAGAETKVGPAESGF